MGRISLVIGIIFLAITVIVTLAVKESDYFTRGDYIIYFQSFALSLWLIIYGIKETIKKKNNAPL